MIRLSLLLASVFLLQPHAALAQQDNSAAAQRAQIANQRIQAEAQRVAEEERRKAEAEARLAAEAEAARTREALAREAEAQREAGERRKAEEAKARMAAQGDAARAQAAQAREAQARQAATANEPLRLPPAQPQSPATPIGAKPVQLDRTLEQIRVLGELRDAGYLTDDEFQRIKQKILADRL